MTHEFKAIVLQAMLNQQKGLKSVLVTVVELEGSSYRKAGVRMLLSEDGSTHGAISGGCVESEVQDFAKTVFKEDRARVMTYDGRYRLGCEGVLYVLLEPFHVSDAFYQAFSACLKRRSVFSISACFGKMEQGNYGSTVVFDDESRFSFSKNCKPDDHKPQRPDQELFTQEMKACFRLLLVGGGHDVVQLCKMAALVGWQVEVLNSMKSQKGLADFPGAHAVSAVAPELLDLGLDSETAVVLMTHNYVLDLKYLLKLQSAQLKYVGVLGSYNRKEKLEEELFERSADLSDAFLSKIYSPAGLDIGAVTPEEIAVSILSEILAVFRSKEPQHLRSSELHNNLAGKDWIDYKLQKK